MTHSRACFKRQLASAEVSRFGGSTFITRSSACCTARGSVRLCWAGRGDLRRSVSLITPHRKVVFARLEWPVLSPDDPGQLRERGAQYGLLPRTSTCTSTFDIPRVPACAIPPIGTNLR